MVTPSDIANLFEAVEIRIPTEQLSVTAPLSDQGLDSLDLAMLFREVETRYSVAIPLGRLKSLKDIADFVNAGPDRAP